VNAILRDRVLLDLIESLERVCDLLDEEASAGAPVSGYFQISTHNALHATIDYLVRLREQRLVGVK
jgi:hypothetical protein